ncbi:hypothetical protein PVL30_003972 [Lodderomyces elongisporus]|uniref:uncharacterized protein n=1 Tax=Lodderomyces elongisporus TaxID=36914 RepID=UPI00291EE686|nr:uncharacterized protein PVL30_003972 [Lodderomyces elongisporus]WLF80196.1 hypothetical protein PVL30_003972 [Lodderomyces elongisporus]
MSSEPSQELTFYKDHTLTPDTSLDDPYLTTITHISSTSPNWLINSLIECNLTGTSSTVNKELKQPYTKSVVVLSFLHTKEFYVKNCKKSGLDLARNDKFIFLDCFTDLFSERKIKNPLDALQDVQKLLDIDVVPHNDTVVFVEAPEVLLYSTNLQANDLLFQIMKLNKKVSHLYLISSKDSPQLVDYEVNDIANPTYKITDFLTKLLFRANLNLTLEPLATGRAEDLTGTLVVSKGARPHASTVVSEREYVYHITKEAAVKVYYR